MIARATWLAAIPLILAGCTSAASDASPTAAPSPVASPQLTLGATLAATDHLPFHFTITGGDDTMSGTIDRPKGNAEFVIADRYPTYDMAMTIRVIGKQSWVKAHFDGGPTAPANWMTVDFPRAVKGGGGPFEYATENDPAFIGDVFLYAADVQKTSPGHFTGVTDMSLMHPYRILSNTHLTALTSLGDRAKTIPFTVTLDNQGRFSDLTLAIPAGKDFAATTYRVTYDAYGSTPDPTAPAASDQAAAPSWLYPMFDATQAAGTAIHSR